MLWLGQILGNARLHKLLHKPSGKRFFRRKPNRAFREIISGKLGLMCPEGLGTRIEGTMVLRSAEGDEQPRAKPVSWNIVADALFGRRCRGFDVSTKLDRKSVV